MGPSRARRFRRRLSQLLQTVRQQLLNPYEVVLKVFSMTRPDDDKYDKSMILIEEPRELRSFLVSFGRYSVFLPWPPHNIALYDYLAGQRTDELQSLQLSGKRLTWEWRGSQVSWPRQPLYLLDAK